MIEILNIPGNRLNPPSITPVLLGIQYGNNNYGAGCYNGDVYYTGGKVGLDTTMVNSSDITKINTKTGAIQTVGQRSGAFTHHDSVIIGGKIYSHAGKSFFESFDIGTGQFQTLTPPSAMNAAHSGVLVDIGNHRIFTAFGYVTATEMSKQAYIYDILQDKWTRVADAITGVNGVRGYYYNGKVYCPFGYNAQSGNQKTIQIYDIATNTWSLSAAINNSNVSSGVSWAAVAQYKNEIWCFCVISNFTSTLLIRYDVLTGGFQYNVLSSIPPRVYGRAVMDDTTGNIILLAGINTSTSKNITSHYKF